MKNIIIAILFTFLISCSYKSISIENINCDHFITQEDAGSDDSIFVDHGSLRLNIPETWEVSFQDSIGCYIYSQSESNKKEMIQLFIYKFDSSRLDTVIKELNESSLICEKINKSKDLKYLFYSSTNTMFKEELIYHEKRGRDIYQVSFQYFGKKISLNSLEEIQRVIQTISIN